MYAGHWTSVDSGMSSAAILSSQSLAGNDSGVQDPSHLNHLASESELHDNENNHDDPSLKPWLPTMQELFSPSNSSGSGDNYGPPSVRKSNKLAPKLFSAQEELQSQMLQMTLDCNSLKRQNKQLKDRCHHYQRLNEHMKSEMKADANGFYGRLQESLIQKILSAKQRRAEYNEEEFHEHLSRLEREKEDLRQMNAALESELSAASQKSEWGQRNRSKELSDFREELLRLGELFKRCEEKRYTDLAKWREDVDCVARIGRLMERMQKELEQVDEYRVASKRAESMEQRVKMLEESLQKERLDRATSLSSVEERLLLENAKLQVSEKEVRRRLTQTANQLKCLQDKYSEAKRVLERHDLQIQDIDAMPENGGPSPKGIGSRSSLGIDVLSDLHSTADAEVLQQKLTDAETVFRQQTQQLLLDKNQIDARLLNLHDVNGALKAENDSLRSSLRSLQSSSTTHEPRIQTHQDQFEALKLELKGAVDEITKLTEANRYAESLLQRIQDFTLTSNKAEALRPTEAENPPHKYTHAPKSSQHKDQIINERPTVRMSQDPKNTEYSELLLLLLRSKMAATEEDSVRFDESERLTLESVLDEKDLQLLKLNFECDKLQIELDFAKKSVDQQTESNKKLVEQVEQLQNQLRQHLRTIESLSSAEQDFQLELRAVRQRLTAANRQLLEKEAELKSVQLLHEVSKTNTGAQSQDNTSAWNQLNGSDSIEFEDRLVLAKMSAQLTQIQYEKQTANDSLQKANDAIEALVEENAELKHFLQQFHDQLTNERNMVCRLTYDKMAAQQQFFVADEECESLKQQKEKLEAEVHRHEMDSLRLSALLDSYKQQTGVKLDARFNKVNSELKRKSSELLSTKRLLTSREKDISLLQNTIELMLKPDEAAFVR